MKKGLTELVIIIDKSGSMSGLESDVVGGFNSLIEEQKKLEGEVLVTTIFFDSNKKTIFDRENIDNVKTLTSKDYRPSGCTALLDTLGNAITKINEAYSHLEEKDIPEHTIFSIMTDGLENSSTQYNYKQIKSLIEEKQKDGWSFLFQAANIDAIEEGSKLGIDLDDVSDFKCDGVGVKMCFQGCSQNIKMKRKIKRK